MNRRRLRAIAATLVTSSLVVLSAGTSGAETPFTFELLPVEKCKFVPDGTYSYSYDLFGNVEDSVPNLKLVCGFAIVAGEPQVVESVALINGGMLLSNQDILTVLPKAGTSSRGFWGITCAPNCDGAPSLCPPECVGLKSIFDRWGKTETDRVTPRPKSVTPAETSKPAPSPTLMPAEPTDPRR